MLNETNPQLKAKSKIQLTFDLGGMHNQHLSRLLILFQLPQFDILAAFSVVKK